MVTTSTLHGRLVRMQQLMLHAKTLGRPTAAGITEIRWSKIGQVWILQRYYLY